MSKRCLVFWLLISLLFFFKRSTSVQAYTLFADDFDDDIVDSTVWEVNNNSGAVVEQGGRLQLIRHQTASNTFPYVYSKSDIFPASGPFSIRIKYKYLDTGRFGDGIFISPGDVPQNGSNPDNDLYRYMIFMAYQDATNGLSFGKFLCDTNGLNCTTRTFLKPFTRTPDVADHTIRIDYDTEGRYAIFLDESTTPQYVSSVNQRRPKKIWFGNSLTTGTVDLWSSFEVDYVKVLPINSSNDTVIVLPGFGGSWDIKAILSGTSGNNWKIPGFVKNYDNLFNSFRAAGYEDQKDLFIFPYDWRKPLDLLADDLAEFIADKNLSNLNLVGHSMGGMVARAYAQKYGTTKINKVLTAGSPHTGVIDMYGLWEGARLWDGVWWQNVLLEIASHVNRSSEESRLVAIRRVSPSILDLLPTDPFLLLDNLLVPIDNMIQKNTYLSNLNQNIGSLSGKLTPLWSDDVPTTKSSIRVAQRDALDVSQGLWEDGKPIEPNPFLNSLGDGTVTKTSAVGPFGPGVEISGGHSDLVSGYTNIQEILGNLGIDRNFASQSATSDNRLDSFVAILRSPGELEVCDVQRLYCNNDLGLYFPEDKLFILPGYAGEDLVVRVKENGFGLYKLHLGNIDESPDWKDFDGELKTDGQVDFYGVRRDVDQIEAVFDSDPPLVNILSPQSGIFRSTTLPELSYSITDNWDDNPTASISGWSRVEGSHRVVVFATDEAGNVGSASIDYLIDNSPPTVTVFSPLEKTYFPYELPDLKFLVDDNLSATPSSTAEGWSLEEGEHTVSVRALDEAGNVGSAAATYKIVLDRLPPEIKILSPEAKTYQSESLPSLKYTVTDDWDNDPVVVADNLNRTEGRHTVKVTATDRAGNTKTESVTYEVTNRPTIKDQCKNQHWLLFRVLGFRNQGDCVKYVEKYSKTIAKIVEIFKRR